MTELLRIEDEVLELSDAWNVAAVAVPRQGFAGPVLLTQSDVTGSISLDIYTPNSSTPVYSTTFVKTLIQSGASYAVIHAATVDSLWGLDTIGHNFAHHVQLADLGAVTLLGGRRYTMVYTIPTARDGNVKVIFAWNIVPLH